MLLNGIEEGVSWPSGLLHGKASFLLKSDTLSADPLKYHILLLLPTLYRRWGSTRLKQLKPWIDTWTLEGMYAGIPGQGAEDAWWLTSLIMESATLALEKLSGGAVDILKCFDSISFFWLAWRSKLLACLLPLSDLTRVTMIVFPFITPWLVD